MKTEIVEIYSDASNAVVIRHPGRKFPGVLIQGDTLCIMVDTLSSVVEKSASLPDETATELKDVRDRLSDFLSHYVAVLKQHELPLPFSINT